MTEQDPIARLESQVAARPGDPVAAARLAVALHERGEVERRDAATARADELARSCMAFGIEAPALEAAELLHAAIGSPETAVLLAELTLRRAGAADIARARSLLEAAVEARPDARQARIRAAAVALGTGDVASARRWIEPIAAHDATTRALYVQVLLTAGEIEAAAHEALLGLDDAPDAVDLHLLLGLAELAQAHNEAAIEAFSEALRLAPERAESYYNLGLAFVATGSRAAALGVVDAGLELAPEDERLRMLRARLTSGG